MTLSFTAFLRISELLKLTKKDLQLSDDNDILSISINSSKTDQLGRGSKTYVYSNQTIFNPIQYLDVLKNFNDDDPIGYAYHIAHIIKNL